MDLSDGPEYQAFRAEVSAFLAEQWPGRSAAGAGGARPDVGEFRRRATAAGYLYRTVPTAYGGSEQSPDPLRAQIVREEFDRVRAPREVGGVGTALLVPTLLAWGTEEQRQRFIPPTVAGDLRWCQGYSEPDAGSDLESLRTSAVVRGSEWVINGQKVWTSETERADWMFLLARTEPGEPRRAGLSYLLLDLRQPGIDVRPLRQLTGSSEFSEVFFTDARTPLGMLVGDRGHGWNVSRTTLAAERTTLAAPESSAALLTSLVKLARRSQVDGRPAIEDTAIRSRLVELSGWIEAQRCSALMQSTRGERQVGGPPETLSLLNKLLHTHIAERVSAVALDVLGPDAMLDPALTGGRGNERWVNQFFGSLGIAIAGGTSNIQRNIIAERGLGMPRDESGVPR